MASKKIPISFNEYDIEQINELIDLMNIKGIYGDFPKAVKFSINLALSTIKNPEKVYNSLSEAEMDIYFKSIMKSENRLRNKILAEKYQKNAK